MPRRSGYRIPSNTSPGLESNASRDKASSACVTPSRAQNRPEEVVPNESPTNGIVARICIACLLVLRNVHLSLPDDVAPRTKAKLLKSLQLLTIWVEEYDVKSGKLDTMLEESQMTRRAVLKTFESLAELLFDSLLPRTNLTTEERKQLIAHAQLIELAHEAGPIANETPTSDDDLSDNDFDSESIQSEASTSQTTTAELVDEVIEYCSCLQSLGMAIDSLVADYNAYTKSSIETNIPRGAYTDIAPSKLPQEDDTVILRPAQAFCNRFSRLPLQRTSATGVIAQCDRPDTGSALFHDSGLSTTAKASTEPSPLPLADHTVSLFPRAGDSGSSRQLKEVSLSALSMIRRDYETKRLGIWRDKFPGLSMSQTAETLTPRKSKTTRTPGYIPSGKSGGLKKGEDQPGKYPFTGPKPRRSGLIRPGCLTCRENHLQCNEGSPCLNCIRSNRTCKPGVRLNFIDTRVENVPILPPTKDWTVQFHDESRDVASEYRVKR